MDKLRPALYVLSRRFLLSLGWVALSYRADLVAAGVTFIVPWLLFGGGIIGLVSVLWGLRVGPVPVDYTRAFAFHAHLSSPIVAKVFLCSYMHGFWLLQALNFLVDTYPPKTPCRDAEDEPGKNQRQAS